ncbi:KAP family P-loop NTPase fold protein [Shewanella baltica]|uniref:KAP family P-loop NTPase fold protein n=1 Tax=Shewanella baltica TaxID=62322 RepID=UPI003D792D47
MKIIAPELQINDDTGFDPAIDIFKRSEFGGRLANLIENAGGNPVIALDAGWGQGKSTFIKMWRGYLSSHRDSKIQSVYFDAFENDYQKDPFLALASEMYQLISEDDEDKQIEFKDKAVKAGKSLVRGALKLTVRTVTAGLIDGSAIDAAEKDLSNLIADQVDDLVKDRFEHAQKDKKALKAFKEHLSKFAADQGNGKPIIFIIDELDRCRPDFALELLEQVKHLFSVRGITFLLVTNRVQLEQSIKAKYGDIDPVNYLHKFINVWLTMPRTAEKYNDNGSHYLQYALRSILSDGDYKNNKSIRDTLDDIVKYYQPSFREIERMISYFAILNNMIGQSEYVEEYQLMIAMACYLKACKPNALKLTHGKLSYQRIAEEANFDDIVKSGEYSSLEYITRFVRYDFVDQQEKQKMIQDKEIHLSRFGRISEDGILFSINKWLTEVAI